MIFYKNNLVCGIIGYGYWSHYPRICRELGIKVKWIADIREESLEKASINFPQVRLTTDYRDIIRDSEVQAAIISTPATTHYKILKDLVKSRKHILCEKPLTVSSKEAKELYKLYRRQQRVVMVGHTFLFNPAVQKIKRMIDGKKLGRLLYCYFQRKGLGPVRYDVNAWWDLVPHDISMLLYFLNHNVNLQGVSAVGQSYLNSNGKEDVVFATYKLKGGILANFHVSWLDPIKTRQVTLVGTKKMVVFDDTDPARKITIFNKGVEVQDVKDASYGEMMAIYRDGNVVIPTIPVAEPLKEQVSYFFHHIIKKIKPQLGNLYHAMKVVELVEKGAL